MTVALNAAMALAFLVLLLLFLTAPGNYSHKRKLAIKRMRFAFRGLYRLDEGVAENTRPAFERAIQARRPIFTEVRLTSDDMPVIVSDSVLLRICDVQRRVEHLPLNMVTQQRAFYTREHILSLADALDIVGGRVPLVLHLFSLSNKEKEMADAVIKLLRKYRGSCMVVSYQPNLLRRFRKRAPRFPRGQLYRDYRHLRKYANAFSAFALSRLYANFASRPQFVGKPEDDRDNLSARLVRTLFRVPLIAFSPEEASRENLEEEDL